MKIISPFDAAKLNASSIGDLVRISHSQMPLALVIHLEHGKPVMGILAEESGRPPYHVVFQRDFTCVRYRPDWVLELSKDDAQFGPSKHISTPGVVHVADSGVLMNFAPADNQDNDLTVNLTSFEWDDVGSGAVAFPRWRIWASESEMHRQGATPILDFSAILP